LIAKRYESTYGEPIPVENLVQELSNHKQGYTQFGGLRPYGVAFLFAGWDQKRGFQLFHSEPSGNYGVWKAASIGAGNQAAQAMLRSEYRDGLCLEEAKAIARRVLEKTMDSVALTDECVELLYLTRESETVCIKELVLQ
jgi:20S proteasome subunit alpha 3